MSKFFGAAALAGALLLGSVASSSAATSLGTLTDGDNPQIGNPAIASQTTFTDLFTFNVTKASSVSASITNVGVVIKNFIMKLYAGNDTSGTLLATSNVDTTKPQTLQFGGTDGISISAGDYVVAVSGTTGNTGTKTTSYGGNLFVSQVPLPSSVALFGVAVLGLGVAGAARRKSLGAAKA